MKNNQYNSLPGNILPVEQPLSATQSGQEHLGDGDYVPRLLPGEQLINVYRPPIAKPASLPSAEDALLQLTNAPNLEQVGDHGPSVGSRATAENANVEELKRFEALFGRDSLIVADFLADQYPKLQRATVIELSKYLGKQYNPRSEQEPGRVPHEIRTPSDPMARRLTNERGWEWPMYVSIDATPAYISAIAKITERTDGAFLHEQYTDTAGDVHTMRYALDQTVAWLERRLGNNPEGLLESKAMDTDVVNQVWKDSPDSYMHADGSLANTENGGVSSIETQAAAYDALLDAADMYRGTGDGADASHADALTTTAARLKEQIMGRFWIEDERGGYFALGADRDAKGNIRPLKVRASNMGHVLDSRLFDENGAETQSRKEALVQTLFEPDMLAAGGIRTLSSGEYRFRPGAYHNGNVWLWDTYKIARGLSRQGYDALAAELEHRIIKAVQQTRCYPEYVRGDDGPIAINEHVVQVWDEKRQMINPLEQPPQEIQAWTVAAVLAIKKKRHLTGNANVAVDVAAAQPFERRILHTLSERTFTRPVGALALDAS